MLDPFGDPAMTHRYPTRYQTRQQKTAPPPLVSDEDSESEHPPTPSRHVVRPSSEKEILNAMVTDVIDPTLDFLPKIFKTLRLFQYLEFKPLLMKQCPPFRMTIEVKCDEFIAQAIRHLSQDELPNEKKVAWTHLLEQCQRLKDVIRTLS